MKTVSIHEAKTHLSRLVKEEFIITKHGKPVARVVPLADQPPSRFGFLPESEIRASMIPADFDSMGSDEIVSLFGAETDS